MLERLDRIAKGKLNTLEQDINFYNHELIEMDVKAKNPKMTHEEAHIKTLEIHGLPRDLRALYTDDAIKAGDAAFKKAEDDAQKK